MLKVYFSLLTCCLCLASIGAEPYLTCTYLGSPNPAHCKKNMDVLFDGQTLYSAPSIIFTSECSLKGCGAILELSEPAVLSKVVVHASKPNDSPWGPEKTEFSLWDEERHLWKMPEVVSDVTGRIREEKYTNGDIATSWIVPADEKVQALKIALYGGGIWLTEIEVYDADGKKISAKNTATAIKPSQKLKLVSWIGGIPGHATTFGKDLPYIGNPNPLPRRDRVVFTLDLAGYIADGTVKQALLRFKLNPMGRLEVNRLAISQIIPGHSPLTADDLVFGTPIQLRDFIFDVKSDTEVILDVTGNVNALLTEGENLLTIRITDLTCDKFGNRVSYAEGVYIDYQSVKMEVAK